MKSKGIKAKDVVKIIDAYPDFALQYRRELIIKKSKLLESHSPQKVDLRYMRQLLKRHPDLFLKSLQSMEAKIRFLKETLNRKPEKEHAFPLMLHYNYSQVIKPRCLALLALKNSDFDLAEVLRGTDEDFCKRFKLDIKEFTEQKRKHKLVEEEDKLWAYVPGI